MIKWGEKLGENVDIKRELRDLSLESKLTKIRINY